MQKEYIIYQGKKFTRYTESAKRNHRVYFIGLIGGKRETLHRFVYRMEVGTIPTGMIVHHKNGNPLDNSVENLELMSRTEHQRLHAKELWATASLEKKERMIPAETPKKYEWHRSKLGRKAMSLHSKNQYRGTITCLSCGKEAIIKSKKAVYCSRRCKARELSKLWRTKHPHYWKRYPDKRRL